MNTIETLIDNCPLDSNYTYIHHSLDTLNPKRIHLIIKIFNVSRVRNYINNKRKSNEPITNISFVLLP
jgi:hypothetical protein